VQPGTYLDHDTDEISYSDFMNKELILFSMADNVRSIPCVAEASSPAREKLWACFKQKLKKEIKVDAHVYCLSTQSFYALPHRLPNLSVIFLNMQHITTVNRV
jgi:DNA topoisomerase-2